MSTKHKICKTHAGYHAEYETRLAENGEPCINPLHGSHWCYSDKDPGPGVANIILATDDPDILEEYPHLMKKILF
jgi:hypothetical protein